MQLVFYPRRTMTLQGDPGSVTVCGTRVRRNDAPHSDPARTKKSQCLQQ